MPRDGGEDHHLWKHNGVWHLRLSLPRSMGGERRHFSTGSADVRVARRVRDRILGALFEEVGVLEVARQLLAIAQRADSAAESFVRSAGAELGVNLDNSPKLSVVKQSFIANRRDFKQRSMGTVSDYDESIDGLIAILGDKTIRSITSKEMRDYLDKLRAVRRFWNSGEKPDKSTADPDDRLATATVVKTFRNIITFFNWAMKQEMIDKNPAAIVDLPTNKRNYTPPPPRELADALCNVPPPIGSALGVLEWEILPWFYRYTGGRLGEIARLTAEDVVVEHGIRCLRVHTEKTTLRVHRQQGDDLRLVPIHPKLAPFVDRALERCPTGQLFPHAGHSMCKKNGMRYGYNFSRLYGRHAKKVWSQMHVHCWRSYVVTETARAGIPEEVRMRLVGHVTRTVHQGYNAVDISRLKEAVEAIP